MEKEGRRRREETFLFALHQRWLSSFRANYSVRYITTMPAERPTFLGAERNRRSIFCDAIGKPQFGRRRCAVKYRQPIRYAFSDCCSSSCVCVCKHSHASSFAYLACHRRRRAQCLSRYSTQTSARARAQSLFVLVLSVHQMLIEHGYGPSASDDLLHLPSIDLSGCWSVVSEKGEISRRE
jgi:hypothetical protein